MKLLICAGWPEQHLQELRDSFPQVDFVTGLSPEEAVRNAADADAMFGRISREVFLAARKLRWIQGPGAGVETLAQIPELVESDVVVTNTRGAHGATIAEHTFAMLLYLTRGLGHLAAAQRNKVWSRRPLEPRPLGISGLTLGLIGLGKIGSAIARRAHAFRMEVIAVDPNDVPRADYVSEFWGLAGLPELLRRADVVVVTAPLTPESRGMLGPAQLALMKPSAYLIAISRGGIVDERALVAALKAGRLAGAGLDVTEQEPLPPESELWDTPNLILTPHAAGTSLQSRALATAIFRDNLARFLAGEPLMNLVDLRRGY